MILSVNKPVPCYLDPEGVRRSQVWGELNAVNRGEYVQIIAPSGSGKTSLVHFICGLRKDFDGDISVNGVSVKVADQERFAAIRSQEISFIFQDLRLFRDQTVFENIKVKQELRPTHGTDKIKEMCERLGIGNKLQQLAGTCSYGEQQRVAIVRALQQPFDVIVMDEPFSHLDDDNSRRAMELIEEEAAARGAAILLADLGPVSFFKADRTLHL